MTQAPSNTNTSALINRLASTMTGIPVDDLDSLRIRIIININEGLGADAIGEACQWFELEQPDTFVGEIPNDLCAFLEWLRPASEESFLEWASAAMSCIEDELQGQQRSIALHWLNGKLAEEVGIASATIFIAEYLQPEANQPQREWAERTFRSMMKIQDLHQKGIAFGWLETRMAIKLGKNNATNTLAKWIHEYQQRQLQNQHRTQPRKSPTKPVEIDEAEVEQRAQAMCDEVPGMELDDAKAAVRQQMLHEQQAPRAA